VWANEEIKIAENLNLREVQAQETLFGLAYNRRMKEEKLGRKYPNLECFSWTFSCPKWAVSPPF
jgi:hypothetical protein